jgi:hypothetical protein
MENINARRGEGEGEGLKSRCNGSAWAGKGEGSEPAAVGLKLSEVVTAKEKSS